MNGGSTLADPVEVTVNVDLTALAPGTVLTGGMGNGPADGAANEGQGGDGVQVSVDSDQHVLVHVNSPIMGGVAAVGNNNGAGNGDQGGGGNANHALHINVANNLGGGTQTTATVNVNALLTGGPGGDGGNSTGGGGNGGKGGVGENSLELQSHENNAEMTINVAANIIGGQGGDGGNGNGAGNGGDGGNGGEAIFLVDSAPGRNAKVTLEIGKNGSGVVTPVTVQGGSGGSGGTGAASGAAGQYANGILINHGGGGNTATTAINIYQGSTVKAGVSGSSGVNGGAAIFVSAIADSIQTVNNEGTITNAIDFSNSANIDTVNNKSTGVLQGEIKMGAGNDIVTNTGIIQAQITTAAGADSVTNSGSGVISAAIVTGDDNDAISNGATISGTISADAGADALTNTGVILGSISMGADNDTVTNSLTLSGALNMDAGNDTVNLLDGTALSIAGGADTDILNVNTTHNTVILNPNCAPTATISATVGVNGCSVATALSGTEDININSGAFTINGAVTDATTFDVATDAKATLNEVISGIATTVAATTYTNKGTTVLNSNISGSLINHTTGLLVLDGDLNNAKNRTVTSFISQLDSNNTPRVQSRFYESGSEIKLYTLTATGSKISVDNSADTTKSKVINYNINLNNLAEKIENNKEYSILKGTASSDHADLEAVKDASNISYIDSQGNSVSSLPLITLYSRPGTGSQANDVVLVGTKENTCDSIGAAGKGGLASLCQTLNDLSVTYTNSDPDIERRILEKVPLGVSSRALPDLTHLGKPVNFIKERVINKQHAMGIQVATSLPIVSSQSGINTGSDIGDQSSMATSWGKAYSSYSKQDPYAGYDGYRNTNYGLLIGLDRQQRVGVSGLSILGAAVGYNYNDADTIIAPAQMSIDSYQLLFYNSYHDDDYYWHATLGYSLDHYDLTRTDLSQSMSFNGQSTGHQFYADIDLGQDYRFDRWVVNPVFTAQYRYVNGYSYDETNLAQGGYQVEFDSFQQLNLGIGVKLKYDYPLKNGVLQPEIHAQLFYDALGERASVAATTSALPNPVSLEGPPPDRLNYNLGVGLTYYQNDNLTLSMNYDYSWQEHAESHSAAVKIKYNF
ncbi:autotransporter family protein [Piscirickettsia litoralis]|uniref:Autotransporter domain-containing protein n=1 Tax=Piscirickettsia litoralis TaxID=1891921 RepID=A0ABX2ZZQ9_9GAMM|nr:autotransporter outer membrane beta-barrel domain-containing protein [Piscirickettsia litoralis]ODN41718.1 hypothetical protein BGC07_00355 [Piscirickettsia litoralis]